jgi:NADH:ubiquinone oxidoreductase subunit B-like Fe-S oxidoreductase
LSTYGGALAANPSIRRPAETPEREFLCLQSAPQAVTVKEAAELSLGRSLAIRHVDAGSCNWCELEIHALGNAFYDLERFRLSVRRLAGHADVLLVTGPVTRNMSANSEAIRPGIPI